ncbi:V-set and immunoglobulin domain-containing protein 4-like isoform X2 [Apus apus]|uniref:V-set and immunoglobulin domain-containing protein 4-like isoform X2 n=1 Tax=Apus apus TaxID=8895 RepID=UPI0021F82D0A|nr:V-set and immunoglobulin domain-containing protein 4-like isoform X2 [Apus apus]
MELQPWAVGGGVWMVVIGMAFISCNAFLDLSGVHEIKGTWMASTTLPCTYMPSEGFTQQTLTWSIERDYSISTIFRRDESGDHILLSQFRDRVSVPKHSPGDISLLIENLEIPDSGHYICQVIWRSINNSLITKDVTTMLKVVKVAVTKPVVRAGELGLVVPAGARTSLTCVASGSPPIRYRWFRGSPGGTAQPLGSQAELAWAHLLPSDAGTYFCQAENRVGAAQRSDTVQLVVTGLPAAPTVSGGDAAPEGPPIAAGAPRAAPALLAALGAAVGAVLVALLLRRRDKERERRGRDGDATALQMTQGWKVMWKSLLRACTGRQRLKHLMTRLP